MSTPKFVRYNVLKDHSKVTEKKQEFPAPKDPESAPSKEVVNLKPMTVKVEDPSKMQSLNKNSLKKKPGDEEMKSTEKIETEKKQKAAETNQEVPVLENKKEAEKGLNLLMMVQEQLSEKADSGKKEEDLRRAQLTMRASEKERLEEERESNKAKKKESKTPKAKGRPRRKEGEVVTKAKRSKKVESAGNEEGEPEDEAPSGPGKKTKTKGGKKRKQAEAEDDDADGPSTAAPKAKAKTGPKRTPRGKGNLPKPDPTMKQEMIDLMKRYHTVPYDKLQDVLHKVYTKKNANPYCSIYWNRPAGGVKIILEDKSETQRFYFSYCYSSIAVNIYMCNKVCKEFAGAAHGWWDSQDAIHLEQLLLITAAEAEKEFEAWKSMD